MNSDQNPAEREAEQILKDAYLEARAEMCPEGEGCAIHFRVDGEYIQEDIQYARLITYQGEYVVVTDDNYQLMSPAVVLKAAFGTLVKDDLPPRFETTILHVGDGAIGDIPETREAYRQAVRYMKRHGDWAKLRSEHEVTILGLKAGLIDVSKPIAE